jgi:hypothetical protein
MTVNAKKAVAKQPAVAKAKTKVVATKKQVEVEKKEIFDVKKILLGNDHAKYCVKYQLFYSEEDTTDMSAEDKMKIDSVGTETDVCFSQLNRYFKMYEEKYGKCPNRLLFLPDFKRHPKKEVRLSEEEISRWTELCKEHKMMPKNIGENFIKNGNFDISIKELPKSILYIYLSSARYVQEEPYFVKNILHFMSDMKMGFFTAFGVSTQLCFTNTGHHIIPESRHYGVSNPNNISSFKLLYVARLASYLKKEEKYDIGRGRYRSYGFNLADKLNNIKVHGSGGLIMEVKKLPADTKDYAKHFGEIEKLVKAGEKN